MRDPVRAVLHPAPRHARDRQAVRPRVGRVVRDDRDRGCGAARAASVGVAGAVAGVGRALLRRPRTDELLDPRRGRARGDRRRGAVRRHGPLRTPADSRGLARVRVARAPALLLRPGRAAPRRSDDQESVLRVGPDRGCSGRARDLVERGDGDRVAGADLGRVLADAPGAAARLFSARHDQAHVDGDRGPDLRPGDQLVPRRGVHRPRARVSSVGSTRRRVRHRGDRDDGDHIVHLLRGDAPDVGLVTGDRDTGRGAVPRVRHSVLRVEPVQVRRRRLRADPDRRGFRRRDVGVEQGPLADARQLREAVSELRRAGAEARRDAGRAGRASGRRSTSRRAKTTCRRRSCIS